MANDNRKVWLLGGLVVLGAIFIATWFINGAADPQVPDGGEGEKIVVPNPAKLPAAQRMIAMTRAREVQRSSHELDWRNRAFVNPPPEGEPTAAAQAAIPVLILDDKGAPTLEGQPVDPASETAAKLLPEGTRLPARADVEKVIAGFATSAAECFHANSEGKKSGELTTSFWFHGGETPMPASPPAVEDKAAACLHQKLDLSGVRDGQLVLTPRGRWSWMVPHTFEIK